MDQEVGFECATFCLIPVKNPDQYLSLEFRGKLSLDIYSLEASGCLP